MPEFSEEANKAIYAGYNNLSENDEKKKEEHIKIIRLYGTTLLILFCLWIACAIVAFFLVLSYFMNGGLENLGSSWVLFWVSPIVAFTILMGTISHYSFSSTKIQEQSIDDLKKSILRKNS